MRKVLLLVSLLCGGAVSARAQATPYYLLNGDGNIGYIVQGGVLQSTFVLPGAFSLALYAPRFDATGSTFLVSARNGSRAVEYNASGTPTGATYSNGTQSVDQLLDGATDGTNTYAARCCTGADGVYRGDMQFGGMTRIATVGQSGVTYASSLGHLFALDFSGNLFELALNGTLLHTYNTQISRPGALAYEASSNSLWLIQNGTNQIYNYSLTGQQLATMSVAGVSGNIWGGEMRNVAAITTTPEPASLGLLATGLLGIVGVARRRRIPG